MLQKFWRILASIYESLIGAEIAREGSKRVALAFIIMASILCSFGFILAKETYTTRSHIKQLKLCVASSQCKIIQTPVVQFEKSYYQSKHGFWEMWYRLDNNQQSEPIPSRYRDYNRYAYQVGSIVDVIVYPNDIKRSDTVVYVNNPPSWSGSLFLFLFGALFFRVSYDLAKAIYKRHK